MAHATETVDAIDGIFALMAARNIMAIGIAPQPSTNLGRGRLRDRGRKVKIIDHRSWQNEIGIEANDLDGLSHSKMLSCR